MRRLVALLAVLTSTSLTTLVVAPAASHADTTTPLWLQTVNAYRSQAGMPAVTEDPALSAADLVHVKYMAATQTLTHAENPASPYYTDTGNQAGLHSDLAEGGFVNAAAAVDDWMHAPFHALGVLRPTETQMGYAQYTDSHGVVWAALDVLSDNAGTPQVTWPMTWPNSSGNTHLLAYNGEFPDVLTSCPGYSTPTANVAGLPLMVSLGPTASSPLLVSATLSSNGVTLPSCVVTETNYVNPDEQLVGREILAENHTILVVPQHPLDPNTTYQLQVVADGSQINDTFTTDRGSDSVDIQQLQTAYDGQSTYVGGFLNSDFGNIAGRIVKVLQGVPGAQTLVGSATTGSDGSWVTTVKARSATPYTAVFDGDASWLPSASLPLVMKTLAAPTSLALVASASTVHKGSRVKLTAPLINTYNNTRMVGYYVSLYAKPSGTTSWRRVQTLKTDRYGRAIFYYYMSRTTYFQARFAGTTSYPHTRASTSRSISVRAV